jgi:hypothetical protein
MDIPAVRGTSSPVIERCQAALTELFQVLDQRAVAERVVGETCECPLDSLEAYAEPLSCLAFSHY